MKKTSHVEMIPISSLNTLEYCPRKFYYQVVQGEMLVNEFMLEGILAHQQVHQPGTHKTAEGVIQITQLYLASEAFHLSGFADLVEERSGVLVPVEYKRGRHGQWEGDHIQLCAQALCLEERQPNRPPIPCGYIYAIGSQRRVKVTFTQQLRDRTRAAVTRALQIADLETPPPPLSGKMAARCANCSLLSICLPEEIRLLQSKKRKM